jgi:hypothetical protein
MLPLRPPPSVGSTSATSTVSLTSDLYRPCPHLPSIMRGRATTEPIGGFGNTGLGCTR